MITKSWKLYKLNHSVVNVFDQNLDKQVNISSFTNLGGFIQIVREIIPRKVSNSDLMDYLE